jgi:hypothetical protein
MIIAKERRLEKNCISQNNGGMHQCVRWGKEVSIHGYLHISKIDIHTYEVQFNETDYREIQQHMLSHRIKPDIKFNKYVKQQHCRVHIIHKNYMPPICN